MSQRLRSYDELVAFLAKANVPHQADAANFAVQVATKPPALPLPVFVRWEQKIPYIQIMQQLSPPIPDDKLREVETAIVHVNDVAMIPGFGFSYANKVIYYRLCIPAYDGVNPDDLDKAMTAVLNNAVQLQNAFRAVVEGATTGAKVLDTLASS